MITEEKMTSEELLAQGWTRMFTMDEPRLSEAVEMYEQLGLEVRLEPVTTDSDSEECQVCFEEEPGRYKLIWTRPRSEPQTDDDLF
jgi:hypothetical protein